MQAEDNTYIVFHNQMIGTKLIRRGFRRGRRSNLSVYGEGDDNPPIVKIGTKIMVFPEKIRILLGTIFPFFIFDQKNFLNKNP